MLLRKLLLFFFSPPTCENQHPGRQVLALVLECAIQTLVATKMIVVVAVDSFDRSVTAP